MKDRYHPSKENNEMHRIEKCLEVEATFLGSQKNSWRRDDISKSRSCLFASGSICTVGIQDEFVASGDHNEATV